MNGFVFKLWHNSTLWEVIGYAALAFCILAQITVGYMFVLAQVIYAIANIMNIVRDYALDLPMANKVRDIVFLAISIGLIIIKL